MNLVSISLVAALLRRNGASNAADLTAHSLLTSTEGSHEQLNGQEVKLNFDLP